MVPSLRAAARISSLAIAARHKALASRPNGSQANRGRAKNSPFRFARTATMKHRRHDIDALRVLAFGLVILYHLAMYYVAGWDWHLKSPHAAQWLQGPMRAVNLWRMDLVFLI